MNNELVKQNSTAVEQVHENTLLEFLDTLGLAQNLDEKEKKTYLSIAKAYNLNPFKREIHVTKYGNNPMSIITGYEVYIKRAERSGLLNGWDVKLSGSVDRGDLSAEITIYRKDQQFPFKWEVYYDECVQKTREGAVTKFWQKAKFMLKKVAISQGFRLCFSDELGGMPYTPEEIPEQEQRTVDVSYTEVQPTPLPEMKVGDKNFVALVKKLKGGKGSINEARSVLSISDEVEQAINYAVEQAA